MKNLKVYFHGQLGKKVFTLLFFLSTVIPYINQHPLIINTVAFALLILGVAFLRPLPKWLNWLFALGSGYLVYSNYGTLRGLEPGLSLLFFFAVLKTWELKKERDLYIMFLISILLLVGHLLNLYSLLGLLHLFVSSILMILLMMMFHREDSWHWPDSQKRKALYLMVAMAVPQALFLFIFFPRFYVGHFNFSASQMKSKLGFTDRLRPGEVSEIINDTDPVFRVNFLSQRRPRGQELYWRGATLQYTDGFNWDRGESWEIREDTQVKNDLIESQKNHIHYQIHFAAQERGVGFTLAETFKVELMGRGRVSLFDDETYRLYPFSNSKMRYLAWSHPAQKENLSKSDTQKSKDFYDRYLQLPENFSPKFQSFVKDKFSHELNDQHKARALMRYFRQENFVYTLRPDSYLGDNAMEEFFFEKRRGFCEHYSSVTALAFRVLGIPARVVTGFQGGLYNAYGDFFVIRGEDAHAWVEAYFDDQGWTRFDPVEFIAPQRIEFGARDYFLSLNKPEDMTFQNFLDGQSQGIERELLLRLDATYFALNQAFIGFDYDAQMSAFKKWGLPEFSPRVYLLVSFLGASLVVVLFLPYFLSLRREGRTPLQKAIMPMIKKLEKKGFVRRPWMSLETFCDLVCQDSQWSEAQKEGLSKVFQSYLEMRFKRPLEEDNKMQEQNLEMFKKSVKTLEHTL